MNKVNRRWMRVILPFDIQAQLSVVEKKLNINDVEDLHMLNDVSGVYAGQSYMGQTKVVARQAHEKTQPKMPIFYFEVHFIIILGDCIVSVC